MEAMKQLTLWTCTSMLLLVSCGGDRAMAPGEIFDRASPGTYRVLTGARWDSQRMDYARSGSGTGFGYRGDGWILTAAHVIKDEQEVVIVSNRGVGYTATRWRWSEVIDVGVVYVPGVEVEVVPRNASREPEVGEAAYIVGYPLSVLTLQEGLISGLHRSPNVDGEPSEVLQGYVQTSAQANRGNSGGPLLNQNGEAMGLVVEVAPDAPAFTWAVPIRAAAVVADRLISDSPLELPYLGGVTVHNCGLMPRELH